MEGRLQTRSLISIKAEARIGARVKLTFRFTNGARFFAAKAAEIEAEKGNEFLSDDEHRAYVVGCVLFCFAAFESEINGLYSDAMDNCGVAMQLPQPVKDGLRTFSQKQPRASTRRKYMHALSLMQQDGPDAWKDDIALLNKLRDALTHYEPADTAVQPPEWVGEIEKKCGLLPGMRGMMNPTFPDKILSHSCAAWALETVNQYLASFRRAIEKKIEESR